MGKRYTEREVDQIVADAVQPLLQRIAQLEAKLAQYKTDSSNSSKPPSSDIVKPPSKPKFRKKRKRGGQPGHRKFEHQPFPEDQVDQTYTYELEDATGLQPLGGPMDGASSPRRCRAT